jgi:hypothetical protein
LSAILRYVGWSADRLFGLAPIQEEAEASSNSKKNETPSTPTVASDVMSTVIEKSMNRFAESVEREYIRTMIPRGKRNGDDRLKIFCELIDRTQLTLFLAQSMEHPNSTYLLFYSFTQRSPKRFGHLGNSFRTVDQLLADNMEKSALATDPQKNVFEWRLFIAYQMAALESVLGPFWRMAAEEMQRSTLFLIGKEADKERLKSLAQLHTQLQNTLVEADRNQVHFSIEAMEEIKIGCISLQNALNRLPFFFRDKPPLSKKDQQSGDINPAAVLVPILYPEFSLRKGQTLILDGSWLDDLYFSLHVLLGTNNNRIPAQDDKHDSLDGGTTVPKEIITKLEQWRSDEASPYSKMDNLKTITVFYQFLKDSKIVDYSDMQVWIGDQQKTEKKNEQESEKPDSLAKIVSKKIAWDQYLQMTAKQKKQNEKLMAMDAGTPYDKQIGKFIFGQPKLPKIQNV